MQPTPEQISYVKDQLARGVSQEQLTQVLKQNGYADELIASLFDSAGINIAPSANQMNSGAANTQTTASGIAAPAGATTQTETPSMPAVGQPQEQPNGGIQATMNTASQTMTPAQGNNQATTDNGSGMNKWLIIGGAVVGILALITIGAIVYINL